ncbi:hypothetical protein [Haloferula sp. BvORR071]|uniref:hypothetical protein n=1 Tax=Haloferula sp. BvORR071 TaxID=1396141 RepID=UPI000554DE64|nr:hypothetical protein [Haloferula sp. BvORR071]
MMPEWKSYALLAAGAVAAFAAGRMTRGPGGDPVSGVEPQGNAGAAKPVSGGPASELGGVAMVRRLESASLAECEEFLGGRRLRDLEPLAGEALLQRLSEVAPERLADLLMDVKGGGSVFASWQRWIFWLGREHPELLDAKLADASLSPALRDALENAILIGRTRFPDSPADLAKALAEQGEAARGALIQLSESDPDQAIHYLAEFLKEGGSAWRSVSLGTGFYLRLARANPAAMQALLPLMRSVEEQMQASTALAKVLAGDDPALAVAFYQSMSPSRARSTAAIEIADAWAKRDPAAALAWVQATLPEGAAKRAALALYLAPIAESDPLKVLALLPRARELGSGSTFAYYMTGSGSQGVGGGSDHAPPNSVRDRALLALMASQPDAALELVRSNAKVEYGRQTDWGTLAKGAAQWLGRDPAAAIRWIAAAQGEEAVALGGSSGFTRALADLDIQTIAQAAGSLSSVSNPEVAARLAGSFASSMALSDPALAFREVEKLPDALQQPWLNAAISKCLETDPAFATAAANRLTEAQRRKLSETIASKEQADRAVTFLQQMPAAEQDIALYQQALERWSPGGLVQVNDWWSRLTDQDGVARSAALSMMSGRIYSSDPATGQRLIGEIGQIPDEGLRMQAFQNLITGMASKDPQAAQALAAQPGMELPEAGLGKARAKLQRYLEEQQQR